MPSRFRSSVVSFSESYRSDLSTAGYDVPSPSSTDDPHHLSDDLWIDLSCLMTVLPLL